MYKDETINTKHFYRFIEFVSKLRKVDLPHERFKLIVLDKYKTETKIENNVKNFADAYHYILNNINQCLTTKILKNSYFLLTGIRLKEKSFDHILDVYYQNYDESTHYLAALIHFATLDSVRKRKIEFAFILSNLVMYKKKRNPLIPFDYIYKKYYEAIKTKDINKLLYLIASMEVYDNKTIVTRNISLEEIFYEIDKVKTTLINKYNISKLFLYGSYAKGIVNESSDLDLLVVFDEKLLNHQRCLKQEEAKKFLSEKIKINIDLIDFTQARNKLDIGEMENIITLI